MRRSNEKPRECNMEYRHRPLRYIQTSFLELIAEKGFDIVKKSNCYWHAEVGTERKIADSCFSCSGIPVIQD